MVLPKSKEIQARRIRAGLSMRALSEVSGVHYSTISKIEDGQHSVTPKTAKSICDSLNTDFDALFVIPREMGNDG